MAGPLSNLSSLLVWLGRIEEAGPVLEEAVEIASQTGRQDMLQVSLINSAEIAYHRGELQQTIGHYEKLLEQSDGEPTRLTSFAYLGLAATYRHQGRLAESLAQLDRGVSFYDERGMKLELGRALRPGGRRDEEEHAEGEGPGHH